MPTDLPEGVKSVEVLRLEPGDFLVCETEMALSQNQRELIRDELSHVFEVEGKYVVVAQPGFKLKVVRKGEADGLHAMPTTTP